MTSVGAPLAPRSPILRSAVTVTALAVPGWVRSISRLGTVRPSNTELVPVVPTVLVTAPPYGFILNAWSLPNPPVPRFTLFRLITAAA